jgi:hypothetical protein
VNIGYVPDPLKWDRWTEAAALLEPARATADEVFELIGFNHLLWAVMDGDELLAVATARLTEDGDCEVILVGGRDHQRWLRELNDGLGAEARRAGARRLVASGRRGWVKALRALGWDSLSVGADTLYSRELEA